MIRYTYKISDLTTSAILDTVLELLVENEAQKGTPHWREGVSPTTVCERLGLMEGNMRSRPNRDAFDMVWSTCSYSRALTCTIHGNTRRITMS